MSKPQQPEIARSGRGATDPSAVKSEHSAPSSAARVAGGAEGAPIPEANLPGHHPEQEQDKPSGDAFVAKLREHAAEAVAEPAPKAAGHEPSPTIAGDALRAAAGVVRKVRQTLPGD